MENSLVTRDLEDLALYTCPSPGEKVLVAAGYLSLKAVGQDGLLCTLTKVADGKSIIPLARSYDSQDWSNAAGEVAATTLKDGWDCYDQDVGEVYCTAHLPPLEHENEAYVLTTYNRALSRKNQLSRFISQATFGVKREDLNDPRWVGAGGTWQLFVHPQFGVVVSTLFVYALRCVYAAL